MLDYAWLIVLLPLLSAAVIAAFGKLMPWKGAEIGILALVVAWVLSILVAWQTFTDGSVEALEKAYDWAPLGGGVIIELGMLVDGLTAMMFLLVTTVSLMVHIYSREYMKGEVRFTYFFAMLSFFTFSMLLLVIANNTLLAVVGWELVGLSSYLLIGFYWEGKSNQDAGNKAFLTTKFADIGLIVGGIVLSAGVAATGSTTPFNIGETIELATAGELAQSTIVLGCLMIFLGAVGKSGQMPLHVWLPDAMAGPTPVSALIHAATMVTAGVFLVCRMSPLIEFAPFAGNFIIIIGALTAFVAATIGLVQNDIKRVIAYSTMSQLGYMFVAAGVGVYSVAMFHLFTHAFFKAMLFLGAGAVIHAMHHEQDMRNYGGLRKKIPMTFWAMMIGTLAITGVGIPTTYIGFAGFFSKDAVVESAFAFGGDLGQFAFWALIVAAVFTSFYSWRLMFLTFFGEARGNKHTHDHAHEAPWTMLAPLGALALGAVFSGVVWYNAFFGHTDTVARFFGVPYAVEGHADEAQGAEAAHGAAADTHATPTDAAASEAAADDHGGEYAHYVFTGAPGEGAIYTAPDNNVLNEAHAVPYWVKWSPFFAMLLGFAVAFWFYIVNPSLPRRLAENQRPLYLFLLNKWYFDEIFDFLFVRPARWLGRTLWKSGDGAIIDGGINGLALGIIPFFTRLAGRAQSGYIFTYAFAMVMGIVVLVTWVTLRAGG
jgi:NADH-quinone oxidoreductase subunit L